MHGHQDLGFVVARFEPRRRIVQDPTLEQVEPRAAEQPRPPHAPTWLQAILHRRRQGVRGLARVGVGTQRAVVRQRQLGCEPDARRPHKGGLRKQFLHAKNVAAIRTVVAPSHTQAEHMAPGAHLGPVRKHPTVGHGRGPDNQPCMRGVDAFVGATQGAVAGVRKSQAQAHPTVVGQRQPETHQAVPVGAHRNQVGRVLRVVRHGVVGHTSGERPPHKPGLVGAHGPSCLALQAIGGSPNAVDAHKPAVLHPIEKGGPPVGGPGHPRHLGAKRHAIHLALHVLFRHPTPRGQGHFRGPPLHLGLGLLDRAQAHRQDNQGNQARHRGDLKAAS